jgi:predicted nucleic acid-binding protein
MIVVADTGPINYLIWIGQIAVLPKLYTMVLIPEAVRDELRKPGAPEFVRRWIKVPPEWLEIRKPIRAPDVQLMRVRIGPGERDAVLLAEESGADVLIVDDQEHAQRTDVCRYHPHRWLSLDITRRPFSPSSAQAARSPFFSDKT